MGTTTIMTSPTASESSEGRRWPFYVVGVVVGVGAAVTGVALAATHPSRHSHHHGPVFAIVFAAVIAIAAAAAVTWALRRQFNRPAMRRVRGFSFAQRRATLRAVNRREPLTGQQRDIAQAQLEILGSSSLRARWFVPVAVVSFAVLAVMNTGGMRGLWIGITVLEIIAGTGSILLVRRQRSRLTAALAEPGRAG
jgi:hypothetical protein